jgi:hypothetical protein
MELRRDLAIAYEERLLLRSEVREARKVEQALREERRYVATIEDKGDKAVALSEARTIIRRARGPVSKPKIVRPRPKKGQSVREEIARDIAEEFSLFGYPVTPSTVKRALTDYRKGLL